MKKILAICIFAATISFTCVSCHGPGGQGGKHTIGMMQEMDAKDIRWSVLQPEFDAEKFRLAVVEGQDPRRDTITPGHATREYEQRRSG